MNWKNICIEEVCSVKGGKRLPAGHMLTDKITPHPYIRARDIREGKINFTDPKYITEETHKTIKRYVINEGEIIITIVGANIGDIAYVSSEFDGANLTENAVKLKAKSGILHSIFLKYALLPGHAKEYMQMIASGSAQGKLGLYKIKKLTIPFPPFQIQQKIAEILSSYDELIENNLKRIKLLEETAQITYEEWFVRLRFPDHESTPINPETRLPEGWQTKAISTICDVNKNSINARSAPEKIRYIDISSAETGYYTTPQEMPFSEAPSRARRRVAFGDTIFSTVRPNRRIFSLVLENDPLLVASTGFAVLTPHRAQNFPFIYLTIAQQSFTDAAVGVAGGAAYPAVNQTDLERIKITVPTQELMNKFSDSFVPNFNIKGQLQRENELLREARDILLPRLMTGVIDVESYDPAQLLKVAA